ncbi:MAG TPA: septum site-determining protein MinC [Leptolyngbyaceae cyanobacterium]
MNSDTSSPTPVTEPPQSPVTELPQSPPEENPNLQVRFKSEGGRLLLLLPPEPEVSPGAVTWLEVCQQLKLRLDGGERFWQPRTVVYLVARDRLLDARQLQTIADMLEEAQLLLKRVYTSRRQTAVAAATAGYSVEQQSELAHLIQSPTELGKALADPLYLQSTVRSGVEIRHAGTIVLLGDANPGSALVAEGDILIWGRLRGLAHAGSTGNRTCRIMALQMQPTQLRIADVVARPPEKPPAEYVPEVAYVGEDGMRIAAATEFARSFLNRAGKVSDRK